MPVMTPYGERSLPLSARIALAMFLVIIFAALGWAIDLVTIGTSSLLAIIIAVGLLGFWRLIEVAWMRRRGPPS